MLDLLESYREMCNGLMEIYLLQASNRMAEVMKTMAIITVFFMPLSFLAGIYGMNFERDVGNMPELGWKYGYAFFWVLVVVIVTGLYVLAETQALDLTMSETYRIFGSELSPYSVKVRRTSVTRACRTMDPAPPANQAEYQKYAKLPLVPLVVTPEDEGIQDSTPIIERVEAASPSLSPPIRRSPSLRAARGIRRRVGQQVDVPLSLDLSRRLLGDGQAHRRPDDGRAGHACRRAGARRRGRAHERTAGFVGSGPAKGPLIRRPSSGARDPRAASGAAAATCSAPGRRSATLAWAAQLYEASVDPTAGGLIKARGRGGGAGLGACG